MADDKETAAGTIKIRRTRRRVYEQTQAVHDAPELEVMSVRKEESAAPPTSEEKQQEALRIVRRNMYLAAGAGLVAIPFFDLLVVTGIQLRMLKSLCGLYGLDYSGQRAKSVVASLIGGFHAGLVACSTVRLIPIIGLASLAAAPAAAGALTYAVGRVFIHHFECGGTVLDFDPAKAREYFNLNEIL